MKRTFTALAILGVASAIRIQNDDLNSQAPLVQNDDPNSQAPLDTPPYTNRGNELAQTSTNEFKSLNSDQKVYLTFKNDSDEAVQMWWYDFSGDTVKYHVLQPGKSGGMNTYATHPWGATGVNTSTKFTTNGQEVYVTSFDENYQIIKIEKEEIITTPVDLPEPVQETVKKIYKSSGGGQKMSLSFHNTSKETVWVYWNDWNGNPVGPYAKLAPNARYTQWTAERHAWVAKGMPGSTIDFAINGKEGYYANIADDKGTVEIIESSRLPPVVIEESDFIQIYFENTLDEYLQLWKHANDISQAVQVIQPFETKEMEVLDNELWSIKSFLNPTLDVVINHEELFAPEKEDEDHVFKITEFYKSNGQGVGAPVTVSLVNDSSEQVQTWWHGHSGELRRYWNIQPYSTHVQQTRVGHPWSVTSMVGSDTDSRFSINDSDVYVVEENDSVIHIKKERYAPIDHDNDHDHGHHHDHDDPINHNYRGRAYVPDDYKTEFDQIVPHVELGQQCSIVASDYPEEFSHGNVAINVREKFEFWCFQASFNDLDHKIGFYVRSDQFDLNQANKVAKDYAYALGRIPKILRTDTHIINILNRSGRASAGTTEINLPHLSTGIMNDSALFHLLLHEACHTSVDELVKTFNSIGQHVYSDEWVNAQNEDDKFITTYAENYHFNEDSAETYLAWFLNKYARQWMSSQEQEEFDDIEYSMHHRFEILDRVSCKEPGMMTPWPEC